MAFTFSTNVRFPGQEYDDFAGDREYNIFRWYRAGWGRYTQADPVALAGDMNLFEYAVDDPASAADRNGLAAVRVKVDEVTYLSAAQLRGDAAAAAAANSRSAFRPSSSDSS